MTGCARVSSPRSRWSIRFEPLHAASVMVHDGADDRRPASGAPRFARTTLSTSGSCTWLKRTGGVRAARVSPDCDHDIHDPLDTNASRVACATPMSCAAIAATAVRGRGNAARGRSLAAPSRVEGPRCERQQLWHPAIEDAGVKSSSATHRSRVSSRSDSDDRQDLGSVQTTCRGRRLLNSTIRSPLL